MAMSYNELAAQYNTLKKKAKAGDKSVLPEMQRVLSTMQDLCKSITWRTGGDTNYTGSLDTFIITTD